MNAQEKFEITGFTDTQLEGKKLFLSNKYTEYSKLDNNAILDSCIVQGGHFYFTGSIKNSASLVSLYLQRPAIGIKQFFIENRKINIQIINNSKSNLLDSCVFENAIINLQQQELEYAKTGYLKRTMALSEKMRKEYDKANDSLKAIMDNERQLLSREERSITINFIREHPGYYASLFWFCSQIADGGIEQPDSTLYLFKKMDEKIQQLPEAKMLLQRIMTKMALKPGNTMPGFSFPDTSGKMVSSTEFKNNYLLIDFWASWCGPCIEDIPAVKKLYESYMTKKISIISISLDDKRENWVSSVKKYSQPWPQVSDLIG